MKKNNLTSLLKKKALELGYDMCGVADVEAIEDYTSCLERRMEQFPHSHHLYTPLFRLGSPRQKAEWARSTIVCIRRYNRYRIPGDLARFFGKVYLFDGRLDYSREYHRNVSFTGYLQQLGMKAFKDEVAARCAAVKAGLGEFGNNNFVYTSYGSWVWIDTWTVDEELEYDQAAKLTETCPQGCRRCIDACPTQALSAPFTMDRGACIAHLSFFSNNLPPESLREKMGTWVYGCDVCQDVCPRNRDKWSAEEDFPGLGSISRLLSLERIVEMDPKTYLKVIQPRFWYIGKDKMWLWKCNALRAMANSHDNSRYIPFIKDALQDRDEYVRDMADWACCKLGISGE